MEIKEFISLTSDYSREYEKIRKSDSSLIIQGDRRLLLFSDTRKSNLLVWALHKHLATGIGINSRNIPDKILRVLILSQHIGEDIHISSDSYELNVLLLNYLKRRYDTKIIRFLNTEVEIPTEALTVYISTGRDIVGNMIKRFRMFNKLVPFVRSYTQLDIKNMRPYLNKECMVCNHKIEGRVVSRLPFNICSPCTERIDYFATVNDIIKGNIKSLTRANIGNYMIWRRDKKTKCRVCNRMFVRTKLVKICDSCINNSHFSIPIVMLVNTMSIDNIEKDYQFKCKFFPSTEKSLKKEIKENWAPPRVILPNPYQRSEQIDTEVVSTEETRARVTITPSELYHITPRERTEESPEPRLGESAESNSVITLTPEMNRDLSESFRYWRGRRTNREDEDNEE